MEKWCISFGKYTNNLECCECVFSCGQQGYTLEVRKFI